MTADKIVGTALCALAVALTLKSGSELSQMRLPLAKGNDMSGSMTELFARATQLTGEPAPDFSLADMDGNTVSLSEHQGQVVLLDSWATWCSPCLKEMPEFVTLDEQYADDELKLIGIAINDTEAKVRSYAEKEGIDFPLVMADDKVRHAYGGIRFVPQSFLIDKKGIVRYFNVRKSDLQQRVEELLAE